MVGEIKTSEYWEKALGCITANDSAGLFALRCNSYSYSNKDDVDNYEQRADVKDLLEDLKDELPNKTTIEVDQLLDSCDCRPYPELERVKNRLRIINNNREYFRISQPLDWAEYPEFIELVHKITIDSPDEAAAAKNNFIDYGLQTKLQKKSFRRFLKTIPAEVYAINENWFDQIKSRKFNSNSYKHTAANNDSIWNGWTIFFVIWILLRIISSMMK